MSILWYIVHSFDVMEKTKYVQVHAESLLIFLYIFYYSELHLPHSLSLFLSVPCKVKSPHYTEACTGCIILTALCSTAFYSCHTNCTLNLDKVTDMDKHSWVSVTKHIQI